MENQTESSRPTREGIGCLAVVVLLCLLPMPWVIQQRTPETKPVTATVAPKTKAQTDKTKSKKRKTKMIEIEQGATGSPDITYSTPGSGSTDLFFIIIGPNGEIFTETSPGNWSVAENGDVTVPSDAPLGNYVIEWTFNGYYNGVFEVIEGATGDASLSAVMVPTTFRAGAEVSVYASHPLISPLDIFPEGDDSEPAASVELTAHTSPDPEYAYLPFAYQFICP